MRTLYRFFLLLAVGSLTALLDAAKMKLQVWLPIRITIFLLWRKTEKAWK